MLRTELLCGRWSCSRFVTTYEKTDKLTKATNVVQTRECNLHKTYYSTRFIFTTCQCLFGMVYASFRHVHCCGKLYVARNGRIQRLESAGDNSTLIRPSDPNRKLVTPDLLFSHTIGIYCMARKKIVFPLKSNLRRDEFVFDVLRLYLGSTLTLRGGKSKKQWEWENNFFGGLGKFFQISSPPRSVKVEMYSSGQAPGGPL